jgi:hypothetical protein
VASLRVSVELLRRHHTFLSIICLSSFVITVLASSPLVLIASRTDTFALGTVAQSFFFVANTAVIASTAETEGDTLFAIRSSSVAVSTHIFHPVSFSTPSHPAGSLQEVVWVWVWVVARTDPRS